MSDEEVLRWAQAAADREEQHVMCLCGHDRAYHLLGRGACIKVVETGACCRCKDFMWMRDLYVRAFRQGAQHLHAQMLAIVQTDQTDDACITAMEDLLDAFTREKLLRAGTADKFP